MSSPDLLKNVLVHKCTFEGCNKYFKKRSKLSYHAKTHTGERPFVCDVDDCNKSYKNPAHLRRHKAVTHESDSTCKSFACSHQGCVKVFANKYSLKKHENLKHNNGEAQFSCKDCKESFPRKQLLLRHYYIHTGIPPYKCCHCDARFQTIVDCNRHKRTHVVYTCECGQKFERWAFLLTHRKECLKYQPKCDICSQIFSNTSNLNVHKQTHKEKLERDVFPCFYENCKRFYFFKKNLEQHIREFHKKENYDSKIPCIIEGCSELFKKKQYLKNHLKNIHSKIKKPVKVKKERKDKNVPKRSVAGILTDLDIPLKTAEETISDIFCEKNCEIKEL